MVYQHNKSQLSNQQQRAFHFGYFITRVTQAECIPCTEALRDRLSTYEKELVDLTRSRVPFRQKKQILIQYSGGFIQDLLTLLVSGSACF